MKATFILYAVLIGLFLISFLVLFENLAGGVISPINSFDSNYFQSLVNIIGGIK